jgi:hypothetical protein
MMIDSDASAAVYAELVCDVALQAEIKPYKKLTL